jgi:hypothetical protein
MNRIIAALGRLAVIGSTAFGIAAFASIESHRSYWQGTIRNVQTVDFNMLSSTLPTKLSYALLNNNAQELQRTINSNYGLFGIVVTNCTEIVWDCPEQKILYMTDSKHSWKDFAQVDKLRYHPFDLLRDPPPLVAERGYDGARDTSWETIGTKNKGKVIGRVYYIRGIPPSFQKDYMRWLLKPSSVSGAHKYYALTAALFMTGGIAAWIFIEWLYSRKRQQELQAEQEISQVQRESNELKDQLEEQLDLVSELVLEREQRATHLKSYEQEQEEKIRTLRQTIEQMEQQLGSTQTTDAVQAALQADLQQREEAIAALQQQITDFQHTANQKGQSIESIEVLNQTLAEKREALESQRQQIELKEHEHQRIMELVDGLCQQLEEATKRGSEAHQERKQLEMSLSEANQQKRGLQIQLEDASDADLNELEKKVMQCLRRTSKYTSGQWLAISHMDVKRGKGCRQFVDCLVIGKAFVVVIEAKNYSGTIEATGDPKLVEWHTRNLNGEISKVACGTKPNPYKQVNAYADSVMNRLRHAFNQRQIKVFSLVVFPDNADVSTLNEEIGGYCRVILLKDLIKTLKEFEKIAALKNSSDQPTLSSQQIKNLLYGRSISSKPTPIGKKDVDGSEAEPIAAKLETPFKVLQGSPTIEQSQENSISSDESDMTDFPQSA